MKMVVNRRRRVERKVPPRGLREARSQKVEWDKERRVKRMLLEGSVVSS